jgi:hypothetical protein
MTVLAPAPALGVSVVGAAARVVCDDAWVRGELEKDFAAHRAEPSGGVRIELRLSRAPGPLPRAPAWSWGGARFKDEGALRRLDYGGGTAAAYDLSREAGVVWSPERDLLRELGYLVLHSRLGWELDRRGLHRAHALGVEKDGRAASNVALNQPRDSQNGYQRSSMAFGSKLFASSMDRVGLSVYRS